MSCTGKQLLPANCVYAGILACIKTSLKIIIPITDITVPTNILIYGLRKPENVKKVRGKKSIQRKTSGDQRLGRPFLTAAGNMGDFTRGSKNA